MKINSVIIFAVVVLAYFAFLYFGSFVGYALDPIAYFIGALVMFGASWFYEKRS